MADREVQRPPSSRDIAGEDFLFHLYRGSELLQDNRVHDAKAELEQALSLQPSDPKGQDLLGIVYFRLGLYPRAISIYEQLIKLHPDAIEPRINLALSYLKTGQAQLARFELERVVEQSPQHARAWGYLGLAFQRLGDLERASYAFQAGGHDGMARRLIEMGAAAGAPSIRPEPPAPARAEMRRAAGEALAEIDRGGDAPFRPAEPEIAAYAPALPGMTASLSGTWSAIEPGREASERPALVPSIAPPWERDSARLPPPPQPISVAPQSLRPQALPPRGPMETAREALLLFPRDHAVAQHPSGVVLVQAAAGFAARMEAVRSMSVTPQSNVLQRKTRGRVLDEPLGGPAAPLVELTGKVELVLGPAVGKRLLPVRLADEAIYLREDTLCAFESGVTWENGRLPVGDGEALPMVQLRGPGVVVAQLAEGFASVEVVEGRSVAVRAGAVLGWVGRVVPRALLPSEAPAGVRGFVAFAGEGMVLLHDR